MIVDERLARGRALTFLLSNDDCQLLCFVEQYNSGMCSGRMLIILGICTKLSCQVFLLSSNCYIFYNLCANWLSIVNC